MFGFDGFYEVVFEEVIFVIGMLYQVFYDFGELYGNYVENDVDCGDLEVLFNEGF